MTLRTGNVVAFDDVDSKRIRVGARVGHVVNETAKPYFGLAYEGAFCGKASATISGRPISAPEYDGGSAMAELGVAIGPPNTGLQVDVGIQAHFGDRRGVSGGVTLKYEF